MKIIFTLVVLLLSACTAPTGLPWGTPTPLSPAIAPNDAIKTYAQYTQAVTDAGKPLPVSLQTARGTERFVSVIRELAKLPSAPSRRYAQALIDSLRHDGIAVPFELPALPAPGDGISYAELAQSDALTSCLSGSCEPEMPEAARMPGSAYLHMTVVVARYAPSDMGALCAINALVNGEFGDIRKEEEDDKMRAYRAVVESLCARHVHPSRAMNLTSLYFFKELTGTSYAMFIGSYNYALQGPVNWDGLHPAIHNLTYALLESAERARSIDTSPEAQQILDKFIKSNSDPAIIGTKKRGE